MSSFSLIQRRVFLFVSFPIFIFSVPDATQHIQAIAKSRPSGNRPHRKPRGGLLTASEPPPSQRPSSGEAFHSVAEPDSPQAPHLHPTASLNRRTSFQAHLGVFLWVPIFLTNASHRRVDSDVLKTTKLTTKGTCRNFREGANNK